MLTKKDKATLIKAFEEVDVKKLKIDHPSENAVRWFRFGSYTGIQIASEIIKGMPERAAKKPKKIEVKSL